ncbi:MAG: phosphoserine transaminase [Gammaproteobacteria bacterium RIFCSPHIGHO2_12_FULL_42_13]|nr:MAG: phosphoserine transaminase [Gammaproteobacteria bacterium RIFCSPHIGHO2_12_FULL_42_13]
MIERSAPFNFSAGPAMLPVEVMQQAAAEFTNWHNLGVSIAEISHRSKDFENIVAQSKQDLRDLLNIPSNYHILFLAGGARTQFASVPMNLLDDYSKAAYVQTGYWGKTAGVEASRYCSVKTIATNAENPTTIPDPATWQDFSDCAYLHYVDNETIEGIEFDFIPDAKNMPLVCDMSSNILSRPFDVSKFGLIYASAQKNISISGITVAIIRDDLLSRKKIATIPSIMDYSLQVKANSLYNTVPTYPWYLAGLVFQWIKKQGGVAELAKKNAEKAKRLYDYLDSQNFYRNSVEKRFRSRMNVIFKCPTPEQDVQFYQEAEKAGLLYLKGHRVLGGIRASIYNAMPLEGVERLIAFMKSFSDGKSK